jgi:hypothetical protein
LPFPLARSEFVLGLAVLAVFIFFSIAARFTVPSETTGIGSMHPHDTDVAPLAVHAHKSTSIPLARIISRMA